MAAEQAVNLFCITRTRIPALKMDMHDCCGAYSDAQILVRAGAPD